MPTSQETQTESPPASESNTDKCRLFIGAARLRPGSEPGERPGALLCFMFLAQLKACYMDGFVCHVSQDVVCSLWKKTKVIFKLTLYSLKNFRARLYRLF